MNSNDLKVTPKQFAEELKSSRLSKLTTSTPSSLGTFSLNWAKAVAREDLSMRLAEGERLIGAKLGLTSLAKQKSVKIDRPVFGFLTDAMLIQNLINLNQFNQPRVEPELVFITSQDIVNVISIKDAPKYIKSIGVGLEVIDSRYPHFDFTFEDVIADNASAAAFAIGELKQYRGEDLSSHIGYIKENGVSRGEGALSELLGDPLKTLVSLSEYLFETRDFLPSGSIILAGSMTNAIPVNQGSAFRVGISGIGTLDIKAV